jgi:hypothetical protein
MEIVANETVPDATNLGGIYPFPSRLPLRSNQKFPRPRPHTERSKVKNMKRKNNHGKEEVGNDKDELFIKSGFNGDPNSQPLPKQKMFIPSLLPAVSSKRISRSADTSTNCTNHLHINNSKKLRLSCVKRDSSNITSTMNPPSFLYKEQQFVSSPPVSSDLAKNMMKKEGLVKKNKFLLYFILIKILLILF